MPSKVRILPSPPKFDPLGRRANEAETNANAGVAQLAERKPSKLGVAGSNPVSRSGFVAWRRSKWAYVAQSVEHFLGKEEVTGSIPVVGFGKTTRPKLSAKADHDGKFGA